MTPKTFQGREDMISYLTPVSYDNHFITGNGRRLTSLFDAHNALRDMPSSVFGHHITEHKNDFAAWIYHSIGDEFLANSIAHVKDRNELIRLFEARILHLGFETGILRNEDRNIFGQETTLAYENQFGRNVYMNNSNEEQKIMDIDYDTFNNANNRNSGSAIGLSAAAEVQSQQVDSQAVNTGEVPAEQSYQQPQIPVQIVETPVNMPVQGLLENVQSNAPIVQGTSAPDLMAASDMPGEVPDINESLFDAPPLDMPLDAPIDIPNDPFLEDPVLQGIEQPQIQQTQQPIQPQAGQVPAVQSEVASQVQSIASQVQQPVQPMEPVVQEPMQPLNQIPPEQPITQQVQSQEQSQQMTQNLNPQAQAEQVPQNVPAAVSSEIADTGVQVQNAVQATVSEIQPQSVVQPPTSQPVLEQPEAAVNVQEQPALIQPEVAANVQEQPAVAQPVSEQSAVAQSEVANAQEQPAVAQPAVANVQEQPAVTQPGTAQPETVVQPPSSSENVEDDRKKSIMDKIKKKQNTQAQGMDFMHMTAEDILGKLNLQGAESPYVAQVEAAEERVVAEKKRLKTGVPGFDDLLEGGIPQGSRILLAGGPGSGKTTFSIQQLGFAAENGEKCLFMTFEESEERLIAHMESYGLKPREYIKSGYLMIKRFDPVKVSRVVEALLAQARGELLVDLEEIMDLIPKDFKPDRVVLDSLSSVASAFSESQTAYRIYVDQLFGLFERLGVTAFIISEFKGIESMSHGNIEEFLADGVILFYNLQYGNTKQNALEVLKMRSVNHKKKIVPFEFVHGKGLEVYPMEEIYGMKK